MNSESNLICFETNKKFYNELKKIDDKKMTLLNDSAEMMESYLNENEIIKVDYIVSSVPLVTLPKKVTRIPVVSVSQKNITLQTGGRATITPNTVNFSQGNRIFGYTAILSD